MYTGYHISSNNTNLFIYQVLTDHLLWYMNDTGYKFYNCSWPSLVIYLSQSESVLGLLLWWFILYLNRPYETFPGIFRHICNLTWILLSDDYSVENLRIDKGILEYQGWSSVLLRTLLKQTDINSKKISNYIFSCVTFNT